MEQKTPANGTAFGRKLNRMQQTTPPVVETLANADNIRIVQEIAAKAAAIIPSGFERVLPRGYTVSGNGLVMARFEMIGTRGQALYGRHYNWGENEANVFLRDIRDGWFTELGSYMRWQLRSDPMANAIFQHALVHLHDETFKKLGIG